MTSPAIAWSDAALALFRLEGSCGVSAGAGSGKTTALVELLVRLLGGDTPLGACEPRQLVAITFTEKAGAELVERVAVALAEATRAAEADGNTARAERLAAARRGLHAMTVGTIHGFAARLLREHAFEAGTDPDFEVLSEEAAEEALESAAVSEVVSELDAGGEDVRVLAGGHGGVRGLAALVARLVGERAMRGLRGRVPPATGDPAAIARCASALSIAMEDLLRLRGTVSTATGRSALAALSDSRPALDAAAWEAPEERWTAVVDPVRRWRLGKSDSPEVRGARQRFLEAASKLPGLAAEVAAAPQAKALAALVEGAEGRYAAKKAIVRALDFDDLLLMARDLLSSSPAVRRELRERTRALLVDEYQDVNGLQAEIFEALAGLEPRREGETRPAVLVAVGDAKQSIYRFRGADVAVFTTLLQQLGSVGRGRVLHLRENHRSVPGVIHLVNDLLRRQAASLGVAFGKEDELRATRAAGALPAAEVLSIGDHGSAEERRGREAAALAARIQDLVSGRAGVAVRDGAEGTGRPPRFGDIAILFRRLTTVGEYERALRGAGIPYRLGRGGGFYQAPEVRDLGELAASLEDPGDEVAWAALLRSPLCGLSDGSLFLLGKSLGQLARLGPDAASAALRSARPDGLPAGEAERLHRFLATWAELRAARGRLDAGELLLRAAERLDLEAALLAGPDGERRAKNLRKALELARQAAARGVTTSALGAWLRRMARRPPREAEADLEAVDAVELVTVHQAKGLEWPIAVVPELGARLPVEKARAALDAQGRLCIAPFSVQDESFRETSSLSLLREEGRTAEAAESMRLLYVALTRARDYLVLSSAGRASSQSWFGALAEAPPEFLRRLDFSTAGGVALPGLPCATPAAAEGRSGPPAAPPSCEPAVGEAVPDAAIPPLRRPSPIEAVRQPVTALAEYAHCPRRHWLSRQLRLGEPGATLAGQDDPDRATERGTLAHALMAEVDLLAPPLTRRALLAAAASRRGYDPAAAAVRTILRDVERFLESSNGQRLTQWERAGALRREVPFLLRLGEENAPVYLDGAIDAIAVERHEISILDFKYATFRRDAARRYRVQLLAYALAASRAWPGRTVRAALWFLRGCVAVADLTPSGPELERFGVEAPALCRGASAALGRDLSPLALGRSAARCGAEGCGYVARCFPRAEALSRSTGTASPRTVEAR